MAVDPGAYPIYFKYIVLSMWIIQTIIIIIILLIELRTFYLSMHIETITEIPDESSPQSGPSSPTGSPQPNKQTMASPTSKKGKPKWIFLIPLVSYSFYIMTGISGCIAISGMKWCEIGTNGGAITYCVGKMFMYIVYIYRIDAVYSGSVFEYNKKRLFIMAIFVVIYSLAQIVSYPFLMETKIYYLENHERYCASNISKATLVLVMVLDLFISILCTYLFVRPLLILGKNTEIEKQKNNGCKLYSLGLKYVILTTVAVISTVFIFAAIAILSFSSLVVIDIIINCVCMLFFNVAYHHYYTIICCGPRIVCNKVWNV
eukprot:119036_1